MSKILLMGLITAFRLGSVLVLFVLLARNVSVYEFGLFSKCFGVAAILGFLVDFGFAQSLLRDIPREPDKALAHISAGLSLKLAISMVVIIAVPLLLLAFPSEHNPVGLQVMLVGYAVMNSFSEFYGVSLRATGRYTEESKLQGLYAVLLVLTLVLVRPGIYEAAFILLLLKLLHLTLMQRIVSRRIGRVSLLMSPASWRRTATRGTPYAADAGVTNISANIDVIILASIMGPTIAGTYQAGQKLTQGLNAFALVLSNVYLPQLSRTDPSTASFRTTAIKLCLLMVGCGGFGALVLAFFPSEIVGFLYGRAFDALTPILPMFGLLLLMRYINGSAGIMLTALGMQKIRVIANTASLATLLAASVLLIPTYGLPGMVYSLLISAAIISSLYYFALLRKIRGDRHA